MRGRLGEELGGAWGGGGGGPPGVWFGLFLGRQRDSMHSGYLLSQAAKAVEVASPSDGIYYQ
jgi:hypothetical protein